MTENGKVPTSLWESTLLRDALQRAIESIADRYLRSFTFSFAIGNVTTAFSVSRDGVTISMTVKEEECRSPDPEPSKDPSTDTEILA